MLDDNLSDYDTDSTSVNVVHFADEAEVMDSTVNGEAVEFETGGFSVYVVIGHEGEAVIVNPRVEFHYLSQYFHGHDEEAYAERLAEDEYEAGFFSFVNKGMSYQSSQVLKDGETLEMITNPPNITAEDGRSKYFFGWYVVTKSSDKTPVTEGEIVYKWTDEPEEIHAEQPIAITYTLSEGKEKLEAGDTISWEIGGVHGTGELDKDGTAHVYLAPIYEDYYFISFRLGVKDSGLGGTIMQRKLVVLGDDGLAVVRIGAVTAPSMDTEHLVFSGWETDAQMQKKDSGGTPVWLVPNPSTGEVEEVSAAKQPNGGTPVLVPIHRSFPTINLENDTENAAVVDVSTGDSAENSDGQEKGYYLVVHRDNFTGSSLDLYPVFAVARWIRFNTGKPGNGATYVPPQYLLTSSPQAQYSLSRVPGTEDVTSDGKTISAVKRNGFKFQGWFLEQDEDSNGTGQQIANADGTFIEAYTGTGFQIAGHKLYVYETLDSLTLYAKWEKENKTPITVLVWKQKVTDDKNAADAEKEYDYDKDASRTGFEVDSGQTKEQLIDSGVLDDFIITGVNGKDTGFTIRGGTKYSGVNMSSATVASDGTTVVNVFYDRNRITLNYNTYSTSGYTPATDNSGDQYAFIGNEWVELKYEDGGWLKPELVETFTPGDGDYGLIDGEHVQLEPITAQEVTQRDIYQYTTSLTDGKEYLIVTRNSAGDGYALSHSGESIGRDDVTVKPASTDISSQVYIESGDVDAASVWSVSESGWQYIFKNGIYYLRHKEDSLSVSTTNNYTTWSLRTYDHTGLFKERLQ